MLGLYFSLDGLRAILVLLLAVAQPVMGYWPQMRKWAETTPSRSARQQTAVVPIEWAFAIWGVIFTGCLAFAIWQILPAQLDNPLLRDIGWLAILVFALTVAWEYYVPKYDIGWPSVGLIAATLFALLMIMFRLEAAEPLSATNFWLVAAPVQLFAGWISAATFVNASSALKLNGVSQGTRWSFGWIAGAACLGLVVAAVTGAVIYSAAIAWALLGVVVANTVRQPNRAVATFALLSIPAVLAASLIGG